MTVFPARGLARQWGIPPAQSGIQRVCYLDRRRT